MHFAFDEQQLEFRSQLRALADKKCTTADLRAAWQSDHGWSAERWRELAELGVTAVTIPAAHGGLGLGQLDLVLLLEEAGRSGLPEPLLETVGVAAPMLVDAAVASGGAGDMAEHWLPMVADGSAVLGVSGPWALGLVNAGVDLVLMADGDTVRAVEAAQLRGTTVRSIDGSRTMTRIEEPVAGSVMAHGENAAALVSAAHARGALGAAALLVGVSDRLLSDTAAYAQARHQFGKAIGSFQAVKHHLATALIRLEFARPLVYRAAWSWDVGDKDASVHCSMAKASASDAAVLAARVALQVHGAIGYTWEHDLHLWMKRAWALAAAWGDAGEHRARVLAAT